MSEAGSLPPEGSVVLEHKCQRPDRVSDNDSENRMGYGSAYSGLPCFDEEFGCWAISNGEYASPVWHCPYCGVELRPFKGENCEHDVRVVDGLRLCVKCMTSPCEHDFHGANRGFTLKNCAKCGAPSPT